MIRRIIIIDDDREMCHEVQEVLVDEGYSVTAAYDGTEGLALIDSHGCDLLLLDLKMPGLDGPAILGKLKDKDERPRVLVLTAKLLEAASPNQWFGDHEIDDMVDGILLKPFSVPDLLAAIKRIAGEMNRPEA
jgi:DNA-binding response OmpR family regulator